MVQRQCDLDDAGDASRALRVSNHGLHRTQRAVLNLSSLRFEELGEGFDFGAVARDGTGAVSFDQTYRTGRDIGFGVCASQGSDLSFGPGGGQSFALAVARCADPSNDAVNAIPISLRIRQPFEDDCSNTFANGYAIGFGVVWTAPARRGQRFGTAERFVSERVVEAIDSAGNHDIAAARFQLFNGEV